jgi:colanic acid biosynthesis glycosyl transferase WcaI
MYFLPEFGSAPILMNELASHLASRGYDVEVVTTIPRPPYNIKYRRCLFRKESRNGYSVKRYLTNYTRHHLGRLLAWSIYTVWTFFNLLSVRKGDVLFLRLPPLQLGVTGILGKLWKSARILLNIQDIHPDLSIESGLLKNPFAQKMARSFEKWIYENSEDIIVISEGFRKNLLEKNVDPAKISIIPNWVDTDFLRPLPKDNRFARKFSLNHKFVVMYSGTISISSILALERVLECAERLKKEKDLLFVIVGEGFKRAELVARAESLRLPNVLFLPFQPYEDLPYLLASSDLLLVPLDKEKSLLSVPSKLYNFMAAGRPILGLAADHSEVAGIIRETRCGRNVAPEDVDKLTRTIRNLKESPAERQVLAANAREYAAKNYAKGKILENYEMLIQGSGDERRYLAK